jgi:AcrR family transcriptional regulator
LVSIKRLFSFAFLLEKMSFTDKQVQILNVAEKLFAEKGFDGASIRDIAAEAGVNIAMISYYFKSKENLMQAIFEKSMGTFRVRVESLLKDDSLKPFQKMEMLIDEKIDGIMERQRFYKIMICEQVTNKNPVIIEFVNELKKKNAEALGKLIRDGQKKGEFKKVIDVTVVLSALFGTISQMLINKESYREFNKLQSLSDDEFECYLKKLLSNNLKIIIKAILTYEA